MVSDCIHHRSAGTEFGHASEVTFSEIGIIIMMHNIVYKHTFLRLFFTVIATVGQS